MNKILYLFIIFILCCNNQNKSNNNKNVNNNLPTYSSKDVDVDSINENFTSIDNLKKLGEECRIDNECINNNCQKHIKGYYCSLKEGDTFPSIDLNNQFNEKVSLSKFQDKNKYILLEMGTVWCPPCNDLAGWLTFGEDHIKSKVFWKPEYDIIYDLIKNNEVQLITVLYEDEFKNTATVQTAKEWYSTFPDENITILADENREMQNLIKATGIPAISLLNSDLEVLVLSTRGFNQSFDKLINILK